MKKVMIGGIITILFVIFIPLFLNQMAFSHLQNKVLAVNQFMEEKADSKTVQKMIKKKVFLSQYRSVEKGLDSYLSEFMEQYCLSKDLLQKLENPYLFSMEDFEKEESFRDKKVQLDEYRNELIKVNESLSNLADSKVRNGYSKKKNLKLYKQLFKRFHQDVLKEHLDTLSNSSLAVESEMLVVDYLADHFQEWKVVDEMIEFQMRAPFQAFQEFLGERESPFPYRLIDDKEGPVIEGDDATIYLNRSIDIPSRVHCYDAVDGDVACQIDGTYDNKKVGDYPITIRAVDVAGNVSERVITIHVKRIVNTKPYTIDVIRNQNVVIVYSLNEEGEKSGVVKVFVCSTGSGNATPTGTYSTSKGSTWGYLYGGVWGQYTTRIVGSILFHSVPYYTRNKGDLEWAEYNKLGTQASLGCVRLTVRDAKWIFYNCPAGTTVRIYDGDIPAGISKPGSIKIDGSSPNRGWDPTDDDPANPW